MYYGFPNDLKQTQQIGKSQKWAWWICFPYNIVDFRHFACNDAFRVTPPWLFHRKRRSRKDLEDPLEAIEGLGAKRLQALLRHFGGRRGIDHASPEDLAAVEGIGPALAKRIWREIH